MTMRYRCVPISVLTLVLAGLMGMGAVAPAVAQDATPVGGDASTAAAVLYGTDGLVVGVALLTELADGSVTVVVTAAGLESGEHGLHAHETGACDPTGDKAFTSAGGHFNPTETAHGDHAGDLGNISVDDDGIGRFEDTADAFTLTAGDTVLLDDDGAAIVIHADRDENDPEGKSFGGRIACGVLTTSVAAGDTAGVPATPDA